MKEYLLQITNKMSIYIAWELLKAHMTIMFCQSTAKDPSLISMQICDPPHEKGSEVKNVKMIFS